MWIIVMFYKLFELILTAPIHCSKFIDNWCNTEFEETNLPLTSVMYIVYTI